MGRKFTLILLVSLIFISMLSVIYKTEKVKAEETTNNAVNILPTFPSNMPTVFIDPQKTIANTGDIISIGVKIFNLSNTVHLAGPSPPTPDVWSWGEPLPPYNPDGRFNYSLGNLYGLDIQFSWDSNILEYVNHTVKIPVETYPDGILHEPILDIMDEVDAAGGTYELAKCMWGPGNVFNKPDDNATIFEMTFKISKLGKSYLNITHSDLAVAIALPQFSEFLMAIPHWVRNGEIRTEALAMHIQNLKVEAFDSNLTFSLPIISGENALISATIVNDGSLTDTCSLSFYLETTQLSSWFNETLKAGAQRTFTYIINEVELSVGNHSTTASVSVSHNGSVYTDEVVEKFRVIGTPRLSIIGPNNGTLGDTVSFTSLSNHTDPHGEICNYTWELWAPGETRPRALERGENATFDLHHGWAEGDWIITLTVIDNYGVEYDPDRLATAPYRIKHLLSLNSPIIQPPTPPTLTTSPSEAPIGSKISIYGEGFTPGTSIFITFEDLLSLHSVFSIIYVEESGAFNVTMILPVANSGNYTIKAIGSSYYYPYQTIATVNFRVTKGLDTLFEELEALREAINQIEDSNQCSEEEQSNANRITDGNDESAQTNIDSEPSDTEKLTLEEVMKFAESILLESRVYVLITAIIAIVALLLSGIIILKRS